MLINKNIHLKSNILYDNYAKKIFTEISLGELLDKISILEIKLKKLKTNLKFFYKKRI